MNEELLLLGGEHSSYPNISNMDISDGSDEFLLGKFHPCTAEVTVS